MHPDLELLLKEMRAMLASAVQSRPRPMFLTLEEAAEELRVSLTTARWMVRTGQLGTVAVGKRRRVPRAELERLALPRTITMAGDVVGGREGGREGGKNRATSTHVVGPKARRQAQAEADKLRLALRERPER